MNLFRNGTDTTGTGQVPFTRRILSEPFVFLSGPFQFFRSCKRAYSRFCWKIWCWGKNLTSKQKKITSLKRTTKEKKTTPFFSKPGRVQYKKKMNQKVPTCRTSHVLGNISDGSANHSKFQSDNKKPRKI